MKALVSSEKYRFYLWVGIAWLSLWLFSSLVSYPETFFKRALNEIWKAGYVMALNIILLEYTIPFIKLTWQRILIGLLLIFAHLMMYSFGLYAWIYGGTQLHIYTAFKTYPSIAKECEHLMSYSVGSVFFFGIIRHIYNYTKLKQAAQRLRIEKQEAELNYLKSQTNPHFLFNTLNNIYSLSRDKSDLAPESILRLSKILRFMLYETGGDYISIEQEIKIISDYIALEKLRYDDTLSVNFNYDIEDMKQAIPPLLLIPLIENAFKHGVSETRMKPFVDIHLSLNKRKLELVVKNSIEPSSEKGNVKESIGLSNLRRQLELLYSDYNLHLKHGESEFDAILKINLSSHV
jgi:sensor histidine kinase YesM